jgi:hypothetical protein
MPNAAAGAVAAPRCAMGAAPRLRPVNSSGTPPVVTGAQGAAYRGRRETGAKIGPAAVDA